jgi:hypothetical protein
MPYTPADAVVQWISDLRHAFEHEKDANQRSLIQAVERHSRQRWMKHDLTLESSVLYFSDLMQLCRKGDFPILLRSARTIHTQISQTLEMLRSGEPDKVRDVLVALNENQYARFFETALLQHAIARPSSRMIANARALGHLFLESVQACPFDEKERIFKETKKDFSHRWVSRNTLEEPLRDFADPMRDDVTLVQADVARCLDIPPSARMRFGLSPYMDIIMNLIHYAEDTYPKCTPWMQSAVRYYDLIKAVRSRESGEHDRVRTSHVGITFIDQRGLQRAETKTSRAIDFLAGLDLAHIRQPAKNALLHGHPFVCGISTHTSRLLHSIAWAGTGVDPAYALLNYMAYLVDIGAHSMQEALWIAYQLDRPLALGLENAWTREQRDTAAGQPIVSYYRKFMESEDQAARAMLIEFAMTSDFAADINHLFQSFDRDDETKTLLDDAEEKAWELTIALHRLLVSGLAANSA